MCEQTKQSKRRQGGWMDWCVSLESKHAHRLAPHQPQTGYHQANKWIVYYNVKSTHRHWFVCAICISFFFSRSPNPEANPSLKLSSRKTGGRAVSTVPTTTTTRTTTASPPPPQRTQARHSLKLIVLHCIGQLWHNHDCLGGPPLRVDSLICIKAHTDTLNRTQNQTTRHNKYNTHTHTHILFHTTHYTTI